MRGGVESRPAGCGSRSVAVSAASVSTHVWARPRMRSGEVVVRENSVITWRLFIMRINANETCYMREEFIVVKARQTVL